MTAQEIWDAACEAQMKEVYDAIGAGQSTNHQAIKHWTKKPMMPESLKTLQPNNTLSKEKVFAFVYPLVRNRLNGKEVANEVADSICSLPNAATSAEAVNKAIEALESSNELIKMHYSTFPKMGNEQLNKNEQALSELKQSNHQ